MIHVKENMLDENTVSIDVSGVLDEAAVPILKSVCDRHLGKGRSVMMSLEAVVHITRDGRRFISEVQDSVTFAYVPEFMKPEYHG